MVAQQLSACATTLQLDTSGSTSGGTSGGTSGAAPLLRRIEVSSDTPNAQQINDALWVAAQAASLPPSCTLDRFCAHTLLTIPIGLDALPVGSSATFVLTVRESTAIQPATTSAPVNVTVTRAMSDAAPLLLVNAPTTTYRSSRLVVLSTLSHACGLALPPMAYRWEVPDASPQPASTALNWPTAQRTLAIPANSLPAGSSVRVTFVAWPVACQWASCRYSASATIDVLSTALVARVAGGSARLVGVSQSVVLDGSASYDPDDAGAALSHIWSCTSAASF